MKTRQHERRAAGLDARLEFDGESLSCEISDISVGGARIRIARLSGKTGPVVGALVTLVVDPFGNLPSTTVWFRGDALGLRFSDEPHEIAEMLAAMAIHSGA